VDDLLEIAGIGKYKEIREQGAILFATITWNCDTSSCERGIEVTRMDSKEDGYHT